jgi:hypothetical protein
MAGFCVTVKPSIAEYNRIEHGKIRKIDTYYWRVPRNLYGYVYSYTGYIPRLKIDALIPYTKADSEKEINGDVIAQADITSFRDIENWKPPSDFSEIYDDAYDYINRGATGVGVPARILSLKNLPEDTNELEELLLSIVGIKKVILNNLNTKLRFMIYFNYHGIPDAEIYDWDYPENLFEKLSKVKDEGGYAKLIGRTEFAKSLKKFRDTLKPDERVLWEESFYFGYNGNLIKMAELYVSAFNKENGIDVWEKEVRKKLKK